MIAAINGTAVGIGITMVLPMDVRIAAEGARFGLPFSGAASCRSRAPRGSCRGSSGIATPSIGRSAAGSSPRTRLWRRARARTGARLGSPRTCARGGGGHSREYFSGVGRVDPADVVAPAGGGPPIAPTNWNHRHCWHSVRWAMRAKAWQRSRRSGRPTSRCRYRRTCRISNPWWAEEPFDG